MSVDVLKFSFSQEVKPNAMIAAMKAQLKNLIFFIFF
jgi:hypothetical protein